MIAVLLLIGCGQQTSRPAANTQQDKSSTLPGSPIESVTIVVAEKEPGTTEPGSPTFELDPKRQDQIWDSEHITFEIETCVGPRFWNAVKSLDAVTFESVLRSDFQGACQLPEVTTGQTSIDAVSFTKAGKDNNTQLEQATEFGEQIRGQLMSISNHASTKFRVLAIRHDEQDADLWNCRIYLASKGNSPDGSLVQFSSESDVSFRFADEAELHHQPVIASWVMSSGRHESVTRPLFREITGDIGLQNTGIDDNWSLPPERVIQYRFQLAVDDLNGDGWLDIATAENHISRIFQWQPELQRFQQVIERLGVGAVHGKSGSGNSLAGFFDMDNDGDPDLVLGNRLLRNDGGTRLTDVTAASGMRFLKKAMGVHFLDYDTDGLLDIYVLYQGSRERSGSESPLSWVQDDDAGEDNHLWKNIGNGRFRNVTIPTKSGGGKRHTLAAAVFHYDDDHLPDIYLANDFSENNLLRNSVPGTFEDVAIASGTSDYATSMGVAAGDIDNDGRSDLYVANMFSKMGRRIIGHVNASDYPDGIFPLIQGSCAGNRLYRRTTSDTRFDEFGEQIGVHDVGWAYAPAMADFNHDGLLDLYATTGFLSFRRNEPDG